MFVPPPPPAYKMTEPKATKDAIRRMQDGSVRKDTDAFLMRHVLHRIGSKAVYYATHSMGSHGAFGQAIARTHAISQAVRENVTRRDDPSPLYDTGDLKRSVRYWMEDSKTLRVGIKDPEKRKIAFYLEEGYTIRLTAPMIDFFGWKAQQAGDLHNALAGSQNFSGVKRARTTMFGWQGLAATAEDAGEGAAWEVVPRPFIRPAVYRAWNEFRAQNEKAVAEGLLDVAIHGMSRYAKWTNYGSVRVIDKSAEATT